MTLILASKDRRGRVFIGSDSRGASNGDYFDNRHKLLRQHNYVVGYSGSYRVGQLIEFSEDKFHPVESRADMFRWVNALRDLLRANHFMQQASDSDDYEHNGTLLILATPQDVYVVQRNYQFHTLSRWAVGSGYLYGLGHFDGQAPTTPMAKRIRLAIEHAADVCWSVGGPVEVWEVKPSKRKGGQ